MEGKEAVKLEVISESSLPATIDSTSEIAHLNVTNEEFLRSMQNLCNGLVEDAVGSRYAGTNLKLEMDEEKQPEVTSKILFAAAVDSKLDVPHLNEIKREVSLSEPYSCAGSFVEHGVVKHEDTSIQSLDLQIKSEVPDLKCGIVSGNKDIYIKLEQLESEEVHIKNEDEESLSDHTIMNESTQVEHFCCDLCNNKFTSKSSLRRHLMIHTEEKPFKCSDCDYKCKQKIYLRQHMRTHTGEKDFQCSICEYKSRWNSNLKQHLKVHMGEKPFKCDVCNFTCLLKGNLNQHVKTHTTKDRPFKCNMCDYKFIQRKTLVQHMKTHTGDKPFKCDVCSFSCLQKGNMRRHVKIHTGDKPYQCITCGYKCIQNSSLKQHIKTHTGEKPFKCDLCNFRCLRKSNMQKHVETHTRDKPY